MRTVLAMAARQEVDTVLIGNTEDEAAPFYSRFGFSPWQKMVLARSHCSPGAVSGEPFIPGAYSQVAGLPMPAGRFQGAGQEWKRMRGPDIVPAGWPQSPGEWRLLDVAGTPAWTVFQGDRRAPNRVTVRAWSQVALDDLLPALIREAGAFGYAEEDLLLEEMAYRRLGEALGLVPVDSQEAW